MRQKCHSKIVGDVILDCQLPGSWSFSLVAGQIPNSAATGGIGPSSSPCPGDVEEISLIAENDSETRPPEFTVSFTLPRRHIHHVWEPFDERFPCCWTSQYSSFSSGLPLRVNFDDDEKNVLTLAVSDALHGIGFRTDVEMRNLNEHEFVFRASFFGEPTSPRSRYEVRFRLDARPVFWAEAAECGVKWIAEVSNLPPAVPPPGAWEPLYSSWYVFRHSVTQELLEPELERAAALGMKTVILDDGWQTDRGDWGVDTAKFPDMRGHVARAHALGLKYMLWFALPHLRDNSPAFARFKDMRISEKPDYWGDYIFDPRYPEVRAHLVRRLCELVREYDFDGFKLDFIDQFVAQGDDDLAAKHDFKGCDFRGVPEATERLLFDISAALGKIKPAMLMEFRQRYVGPVVRKYGNMLRANDCPGDYEANRYRTLALRVTSPGSAVHSDMLLWRGDETATEVKRQIWNVMFSVIQYSANLGKIPETHLEAVRDAIRFTTEHANTLLHGRLVPHRPELGYPCVEAESGDERIIAVYQSEYAVKIPEDSKRTILVNATTSGVLLVDYAGMVRRVAISPGETADFTIAIGLAQGEKPDPRERVFVPPLRIVWQQNAIDADLLVGPRRGQIPEGRFLKGSGCVLERKDGEASAVLLDFGRELHGGIQIGNGFPRGDKVVRIRFGESVGEAMSELGEKGAQNDHAIRDLEIKLPWLGQLEFGNTAFRFVRIDAVSEGPISIQFVRAVSLMRPMARLGGFRCSDPRLNKIFDTAVRTVHLCSQDYLWDGAKRDRLVWQGDMHPEVATLLGVYGGVPVISESLDYMVGTTPTDCWMNNKPSYTMWWVLCLRDYWLVTADRAFLERHKNYFRDTVLHLVRCVSDDGSWLFPDSEQGFLDWPTNHNAPAVMAGMRGLYVWALSAAIELCQVLGEDDVVPECESAIASLRQLKPSPEGAKAAAALLAIGGVRGAGEMFDEVLGRGGVKGVSTFYGWYMLEAMSAAGKDMHALETIRQYWGGMLDMGATSFWEDFDTEWMDGSTRLDEMPVAGRKNIHGDFGDFCYVGYRHSFCHGWSSGPAAWLQRHVLGVRIVEPGGGAIEVKPFLGDLDWAEGAIPTARGVVRIRVSKNAIGELVTSIDAPRGVRVIR